MCSLTKSLQCTIFEFYLIECVQISLSAQKHKKNIFVRNIFKVIFDDIFINVFLKSCKEIRRLEMTL